MGLVIKAALGALVVLLIGVYLASLWYFTGMMRLPAAFVGSVACWGISAWVLIICWIKLH